MFFSVHVMTGAYVLVFFRYSHCSSSQRKYVAKSCEVHRDRRATTKETYFKIPSSKTLQTPAHCYVFTESCTLIAYRLGQLLFCERHYLQTTYQSGFHLCLVRWNRWHQQHCVFSLQMCATLHAHNMTCPAVWCESLRLSRKRIFSVRFRLQLY